MSRTSGIFTESSDRNQEIDLCRLCREKHDCYYSIFTSNVACQITVKDALHDLVGLQVAVGDGLPTTMCPLCLKKLTEFSVFKKICLESNAILRKSLPRSCFRSFEAGGADDEWEPCVETKDCIQDAIENTSEFTYSAQMNEVVIPVPDCLLPRDDKLCHVKEENQDHLREENYPVLYTDSAGISNYDADPLMTDELSDPVTYKCSPVKEDQISDDEEGLHVLNDCSDGVSNKLMHQDSSDQALEVGAEADEPESVLPEESEGYDEEKSFCLMLESDSDEGDECRNGDAGTKVALEVGAEADEPESVLPEESEGYDEEKSFCLMLESDSDEGDECRNGDAGTKVDADCDHMQAQASTSSQGKEVDAEGTGAIVIVQDSMPVLAKKESPKETDATEPTYTENGELIQKQTMAIESMTETLDLPAPARASDIFPHLEPKISASQSRKAWKVMDKDIEICDSLLADKITLCSIPGDGQFHSKSRRLSKIRGDRATTTVAGGISGCDNPDTTKIFRVTDSGKSGSKAFVREKKEISTSMIRNPGKLARSRDTSYHCFNCGDAFNAKYDLTEHLKIHFGSGSLDIDANLSIGKHLALQTLVSRSETDRSYQPTSSKSLNKVLCKRQGVRQKRNGLFKENFGGTTEKKNVREVRRRSIVDRKSCTNSPRTTKKPYSCGECDKSFSYKSHLVYHIRTHTKEKPYSCGECEKSFSRKSHLIDHIRTHTKEKPYSCGECEKSFSRKSNLINHIRTHTKEKPYSCNECEKSFSVRSTLVCHMRIHTNEKPYSRSECEKSYSHKSHLIYHIRTHTKEKPYSCGECEKSFSRKSHLSYHIRTHTKEKPYSCGECEKSFSVRSSLARHLQTPHTEEKSYSCNECEKSFTTKRNLVLHMRVHRKEALFLH